MGFQGLAFPSLDALCRTRSISYSRPSNQTRAIGHRIQRRIHRYGSGHHETQRPFRLHRRSIPSLLVRSSGQFAVSWCGATILDQQGQPVPVTPDMIGVDCAHIGQVNGIDERLGPDLNDVFVESANRFQGLERPLMFVLHPLSGRADATDFHLDAGRLCVLFSRHRVAC